jgi:3D (Asp-Asp-Asp) domain-containing protein
MAYLFIFIIILGSIFVVEVRLPPGFPFGGRTTGNSTGLHVSCTSGWIVTGYFTPLETDYSGLTQNVTVNGTLRSFYSSFLSSVKVEGWGLTNAGDYLGYENGVYFASKFPRNSLDATLKVGDLAVDFSVIQAGTNLTIPSLSSPWNSTKFTADDTGADIVGKHVDVYAGLGTAAEQATNRITGNNQTVCALPMAVGAPGPSSIGIATAEYQIRPRMTLASTESISSLVAIKGLISI